MIYYHIEKSGQEILLREPKWDSRYAQKTETVFAQCNGYLGVRAAYETKLLKESRGMFVGGLYHRAGEYEDSELINCPDVTEFQIQVNGQNLNPDSCKIHHYERTFSVMTGELKSELNSSLPNGARLCLETQRFASLEEKYLFCHRIQLTCETESEVEITTGINGQITNSGVSHFQKTEARVLEKNDICTESFCDDGQVLRIMSVCRLGSGGDSPADGNAAPELLSSSEPSFGLNRKSIYAVYRIRLKPGERLVMNKFTAVAADHLSLTQLQKLLQTAADKGYDNLLKEHKRKFSHFWKYAGITIEGADLEEEAAIAFAQYHLLGMAPSDTSDYSIAAKGLTGEGYKGHVFWDTEVFVMPFFTALFPDTAKNLLLYRYHRLDGAKKKAAEYGYEGALYPWESAGSGMEETPRYAALNIHTGKANPVWSGIKEHHVTADIIYGVWNYYKASGDQKFMEEYGNEMILETAKFWYSRAAYQADQNRYEILDVIGPDEYTEHVNNNAYTNYMAYENVRLAAEVLKDWKDERSDLYLKEGWDVKWQDFLDKLYLPRENEERIIGQDDTFLCKKELKNIQKYRESKIKQEILMDFSRDEVVDMQVLKQADVVMLFNLLPDRFCEATVKQNVRFYEPRTIHDSSLSYCSYAKALARIGDVDQAYDFFRKAMETDLNTNDKDSIDGVHAASLGGVWSCIIEGFAGVDFERGEFKINSHLPKHWSGLSFWLKRQGIYYRIEIRGNAVQVTAEERCLE